jgi:hypothetical protein
MGPFSLGEFTPALGVSVGEARRVAEALAKSGVPVKLDEDRFMS